MEKLSMEERGNRPGSRPPGVYRSKDKGQINIIFYVLRNHLYVSSKHYAF